MTHTNRRFLAILALVVALPLVGHANDDASAVRAAEAASQGAKPLSGNGYKVALVRGAVEEALSALR